MFVTALAAAASLAMSLPLATDAAIFRLPPRPATKAGASSFDTPALTPVAFLTAPFWPDIKANPNSIEAPFTARWSLLTPVHPETNARHIEPDVPFTATAAFYGPPRQRDTSVDRLSFDTPSLAPMAFVRFCMRYPQDCEIQPNEFWFEPVALTKRREVELTTVNRDVNRAIRPQANVEGVMAEEWLISPVAGDCNDYAVTKRHELLVRGWPSHSLLLLEVVVPSGEHHLVLFVRTREDDFVLDNLDGNVLSVSQTGYRLVRAQQVNNPKFWSMVKLTRATRVAMDTR